MGIGDFAFFNVRILSVIVGICNNTIAILLPYKYIDVVLTGAPYPFSAKTNTKILNSVSVLFGQVINYLRPYFKTNRLMSKHVSLCDFSRMWLYVSCPYLSFTHFQILSTLHFDHLKSSFRYFFTGRFWGKFYGSIRSRLAKAMA